MTEDACGTARAMSLEDIGTSSRELEWKTPIFHGSVAPKNPNAPCAWISAIWDHPWQIHSILARMTEHDRSSNARGRDAGMKRAVWAGKCWAHGKGPAPREPTEKSRSSSRTRFPN